MQGTAQVRSSLVVTGVSNSATGAVQVYQSQPTLFTSPITGNAGPSPGQVTATPAGVIVSLAALTSLGGLCQIVNQEFPYGTSLPSGTASGNWIEVGAWIASSSRFYPILEVLPQESYIVRLSRILGKYEGTGTGTLGSGVSLMLKSFQYPGATYTSASALVLAFDK